MPGRPVEVVVVIVIKTNSEEDAVIALGSPTSRWGPARLVCTDERKYSMLGPVLSRCERGLEGSCRVRRGP